MRRGKLMRGWVCSALLLVAIAPSRASADERLTSAVAPSATDLQQASALVRRGVTLYKQHQYEAARQAFAEAFARAPGAGTLLNLALSELKGDRPVEAVAHFRQYLAQASEPADKRAAVRTTFLPMAEAATSRLDIFAPAKMEVRVDGVLQPRPSPSTSDGPPGAPTSVVVRSGEHDVSVTEGSLAQTQHVAAHGGELVEVHFQSPPATPGPLAALPASNGVDAPAPPPRDRARTAKWITVLALGSGAVVAAGLGIGLGLEARNQASRARSERTALDPSGTGAACMAPASASPSCRQLGGDVQSAERNWSLSIASYAAAGVLGAATAATWTLWHPERTTASALSIVPTVGWGQAGLVVRRSW